MVDAGAADDLAQEVLIRIVGSLHRVTADHQVRGWVLGIARHVCLDEIRRRQRRRRIEAESARHRPEYEDEIGGDLVVRDLVEHLDPDRREAFVLTQIVGLSYDEAATVCECPVGTVRSRVSRARLDLRAMLERENVGDSGTFPPPQATGSS